MRRSARRVRRVALLRSRLRLLARTRAAGAHLELAVLPTSTPSTIPVTVPAAAAAANMEASRREAMDRTSVCARRACPHIALLACSSHTVCMRRTYHHHAGVVGVPEFISGSEIYYPRAIQWQCGSRLNQSLGHSTLRKRALQSAPVLNKLRS